MDILLTWSTRKRALDMCENVTFVNEYGQILDLLSISINGQMLKLVLHFWDLYYRCFSFGNVDLMRTIQEYLDLLWSNDKSLTQLFALKLDSIPYRHFSNL